MVNFEIRFGTGLFGMDSSKNGVHTVSFGLAGRIPNLARTNKTPN